MRLCSQTIIIRGEIITAVGRLWAESLRPRNFTGEITKYGIVQEAGKTLEPSRIYNNYSTALMKYN